MLAIVGVLLIVATSIVVTRVATIALTLTGMSRESARFQARSALTGVGFTTTEAEKVVNHPVRRRIVMTLMLLGSAGIISVIASLFITFVGEGGQRQLTQRALVLLAGVGVLLGLSSLKWVDKRLQRVISLLLGRFTDLDTRDYAALLHVHGDFAISELQVQPEDWLANRALKELDLIEEGLLVLGVQRSDGVYVGAPKGETTIRSGDVMILYGRTRRLDELDERRAGWLGDAAHSEAVGEQERQLAVQRGLDEEADQEIRPTQKEAG